MIGHLVQMLWNRRWTNLLLVIELGLSFVVLAVLFTGLVKYWAERYQPLGFDYQQVWYVALEKKNIGVPRDQEYLGAADLAALDQVAAALQGLAGVEAAVRSRGLPFNGGINGFTWQGRHYGRVLAAEVGDQGLEVLGLRLLHGRWFEPGDAALDWTPVVVDRELSQTLLAGEEPVGQVFESIGIKPGRVVGVVENTLYAGHREYPGFIFTRLEAYPPELRGFGTPKKFLLRVAPGGGNELKEQLRIHLRALLPGWSVEVGRLPERWAAKWRDRERALGGRFLVGAFLGIMVALGLVGVLGQNVRRRTVEIGIRRAVGAPQGLVYGQFLGELLLLALLGTGLGGLALVQFGLLPHFYLWDGPGPHLACASGAAVLLYGLVVLCGLYPSWQASRVQPSAALHCD